MKPFLRHGNQVGFFLVFLYIICMLWFWVNPVQLDLHMDLMQLMFIGFNDMNIGSFILGLIQSYIWGYIFLAVWIGSCRLNDLCQGRRK